MDKPKLYSLAIQHKVTDWEMLQEAMVFHIDEIGAYYWHSTKTDWSIDSNDFPNIAPPYARFFMQYRQPMDYVISTEGRVDNPIPSEVGFLFQAARMDNLERMNFLERLASAQEEELNKQAEWVLTFRCYILQSGKIVVFPFLLTLAVDSQGRWCKLTNVAEIWITPDKGQLPLTEKQGMWLTDKIFSFLHPCLLAISMLHCKNVVVEAQESYQPKGKRLRGKEKDKAAEPRYTFHTLNIQPMRKIIQEAGGETSEGRLTSLHMVRGHFRDYSHGRGLFGKHKGLYWWDPFARGSIEVGVSDKDYEVKKGEKNGS